MMRTCRFPVDRRPGARSEGETVGDAGVAKQPVSWIAPALIDARAGVQLVDSELGSFLAVHLPGLADNRTPVCVGNLDDGLHHRRRDTLCQDERFEVVIARSAARPSPPLRPACQPRRSTPDRQAAADRSWGRRRGCEDRSTRRHRYDCAAEPRLPDRGRQSGLW